jgi:hypothetical protein
MRSDEVQVRTSVASDSQSVSSSPPISPLREVLESLASLKLTVWLMAMMIFLVLAGTLAQAEKEIWQVVDGYFRTFIT